MIVSVLHLGDSKAEQKLFKIRREAYAFDVRGRPVTDGEGLSEGSALIVKVGSEQSKMLACDAPVTACAVSSVFYYTSEVYFVAGEYIF